MKDKTRNNIEQVITILRRAGYEPYERLYAYAVTGNEAMITRQGNARKIVASLDRKALIDYIAPHINQA